jgi:hypothetical protein
VFTPAAPRSHPHRVFFTLALGITILATAALTGTLVHEIRPADLAAGGFDAGDLTAGRWLRLFLATFIIPDPYTAVSVLATVFAFVGACEVRLGTVRTVVVYAVSHVAGVAAMFGLAIALASFGSEWGSMTLAHRAIGASAGAFGALAAWLVYLPPLWRRVGVVSCAVFLTLSFARDVHPWDVSHAAAFLAGLAVSGMMHRRDLRRGHPVDWRLSRADHRRLAAGLAGTVGMIALLVPFAIAQQVGGWLRIDDIGAVRDAFFAAGSVTLAATPGLRRGTRASCGFALAGAAVPVVGLWQPGAPGIEHLLALVLVVLLARWRADFRERASGPGGRAAVALPLLAAAYVPAGFIIVRHHFVPPLDAAGMVDVALLRLRLGAVPEPNWYSPVARWFLRSLPLVVYGAGFAAAAVVAWRATRRQHATPDERLGGGAPQTE